MPEEVSLRESVTDQLNALEKFLTLKIDGNKELQQSERKDDKAAVETAFKSQQTALQEAKAEAEKKNEQLNDVRLRFVSKEVYDKYIKDQGALFKWGMIGFITMGLTIIGLGLTVIGMLMSWKDR
jgi:hypothetical protein